MFFIYHLWGRSFNPSPFDLFQPTWYYPYLSNVASSCMVSLIFFSWVVLCAHVPEFLYLKLFLNTWVVSRIWQLWIILQWTYKNSIFIWIEFGGYWIKSSNWMLDQMKSQFLIFWEVFYCLKELSQLISLAVDEAPFHLQPCQNWLLLFSFNVCQSYWH